MRALEHLTAEFPSRPKPGGKRDPQRLIEIPDLAFSPKRLVISPWLISKPRMMMSQGHPDATARCLQKVAAIHQPPFPLLIENSIHTALLYWHQNRSCRRRALRISSSSFSPSTRRYLWMPPLVALFSPLCFPSLCSIVLSLAVCFVVTRDSMQDSR